MKTGYHLTVAKKDAHLLLFHGAISIASFFAIIFFNSDWAAAILPKHAAAPYTIDIGVEHNENMTLGIDISTLNGEAIIELTNKETEETVAVSVPETWTRREVRNAPIDQVTSDNSAFGFIRWQLPKNGTISFRVPKTPEKIILHNPTEKTMKVELAFVDLDREQIEKDIILVQEATAELW